MFGLRTFWIVVVISLLSSCGVGSRSMSDVMDYCDREQQFHTYVDCIKSNYERYPDSRVTKSFYAILGVLNEDLENKLITERKAFAGALIAYEMTIGQDNARKAAAFNGAVSAIAQSGAMNNSSPGAPRPGTMGTIGGARLNCRPQPRQGEFYCW